MTESVVETSTKPGKNRKSVGTTPNKTAAQSEVPNGEVHSKPKVKKQKTKPQVEPLVKHKEEKKWFEYQVDGTVEDPATDKVSDEQTKEMFGQADILLRTDFDLHSRMLRSKGGSEASWLLSVVKKGTASDRMTAMQLQMHQSPVHSLPYAESMIGTIEKKNTREAMDVIPILEEIFLNHFLPLNRKLASFTSRPLSRINEFCSNREQGRNRILVLWMFEHKLKLAYERFLKALEIVAAGVVEDLSRRALRTALNLLAERPEGEQQLLTMLVNKLGHPNYRIGAYVATLLEELTRRQPNMRPVIVKETERLVYRKNVSERAHLYAATFLSQICLRAGEDELAVQMLSIYFGLFKTLISRKKTDNRLLAILLTAANRAFPYAKEKAESLTEDINALYKVVHTGSYSVALQTMKLLFQILQLSDSLSDRFYSVLYRKLVDPVPPACYNQLMLLLFRSMKSDASETRVRTFVKRLLQVATGAPPPLAAGILILVSKLAEQRPNLLVLKCDVDKVAKATISLGDDDEEEHFVDVGLDGKPLRELKGETKLEEGSEDEEDVAEKKEEKKTVRGQLGPSSAGGWVHKTARVARSPYENAARNPLFIDCRQLADSELLLLSRHYHPSVAIFAQQLLEGKYLNYKGDPLQDYTMMKFLDRFAYKNPKDGSAPTSSVRVARKKAYDPWGVKKLALSSKEYLSKKSSELPPDERYLHRFAQLKFQSAGVKKNDDDDWDIESVGSEEFDRIIERFEPGEANDDFEINFGEEFSAEKQRKRVGTKRAAAAEESDGEDDELDEDEYGEDDDEDEDVEMDNEDDDEEEDDDDVEMESDDDEDERAFGRKDKGGPDRDSDSDGEDFGDNDAEMAADRFGVMLEEYEDEEAQQKKLMKHKTRKPKGYKKRK